MALNVLSSVSETVQWALGSTVCTGQGVMALSATNVDELRSTDWTPPDLSRPSLATPRPPSTPPLHPPPVLHRLPSSISSPFIS